MIKVGNERTIAFDKKLRYERQQFYNIQDYESVPYDFSAGTREVYKNFNFSIFVDDYCNADCRFCVAQLRYSHKNKQYEKKHIADPDAYLQRLEEVLKIVRPLNPSVSITGGEPTISPLLVDILKLVDAYEFRKRTITTNGSGLLRTTENDTVLQHLIHYGWNHLNISRAHYLDVINQEIMRYKDDAQYCSNEMLREILTLTKGSPLHHRISCLLLKSGINSVQEIKQYIDTCHTLGADNYIFRELMDYDRSAVNLEKMRYCDDNKIRLNEIWKEFENYKVFEPFLNLLGYYYYVEIYHYNDITIASESADLNQQYKEKEAHQNRVYEMIFHNNGNLCGSWIDNEEILDEYKER